MSTAPREPDSPLARGLQAYCQSFYLDKDNLAIDKLEKLPSGWESELYAFHLEYDSGNDRHREALVLRMYAGDNAGSKALHEYESLGRLHQSGFPVPQAVILESNRELLGSPFILMEWIQGQSLSEVLFAADPSRQQSLLSQFCRLFVRLHRLDWQKFVHEAELPHYTDPYYPIDSWIGLADELLGAFKEIDFRIYLNWLVKRRDELACPKPSPVHRDYHPNNVLIQEDGAMVVIDWTGFQVTDARHDLAWTLMLAEAYQGEHWHRLILECYEQTSGKRVDQLEAFEVCACLRRLYDLSVSTLEGPERQGMLAESIERMKADRAAHQRVYARLVRHTGLRSREMERLLESLR